MNQRVIAARDLASIVVDVDPDERAMRDGPPKRRHERTCVLSCRFFISLARSVVYVTKLLGSSDPEVHPAVDLDSNLSSTST